METQSVDDTLNILVTNLCNLWHYQEPKTVTNVIIHKVANIMLSPTSLCDKYERSIIGAFESVFYWLEGPGHTVTV